MQPTTRSRLDQALATWPEWPLPLTAPPVLVAEVPGGRTNINLRLKAPGLDSDLLMRLNHPDPARLGIDRDRERRIIRATAQAGLGKAFWHWDSAGRFVLFPWIEARPWDSADFAAPEQRKRLWSLIEQLRAIRIDCPRRRYADYLVRYWCQLERAGRVSKELRKRWEAFEARLADFDRGPWTACLVHHDLIPANVLEASSGLYLIDWEYAAPGHPDIDRWSIDPATSREPFVAELMGWINDLWERLRVAA